MLRGRVQNVRIARLVWCNELPVILFETCSDQNASILPPENVRPRILVLERAAYLIQPRNDLADFSNVSHANQRDVTFTAFPACCNRIIQLD